MKKSVIFRGPVLTQSGYGTHAAQCARWLLQRPDVNVTFQPTQWGDTPWNISEKARDGLCGEIMKRTGAPANADISIQLQLPNEWDPKLGKFNVGMTAGVETDRCNPKWIDACNTMNLVIVPSEHAKRSLTSNGQVPTTPVIIVPESYADACALPDEAIAEELESLTFSTKFNFLIFGQITGDNPHNDRKNTFFAVKWLCEMFKDDPDVGIVIKTNVGRNSTLDRDATSHMFKALLTEVRKGQFPRIHLIHGEMCDKEVAALYRNDSVKALLAPTRGEGYGLPILEAAVSGLPVIATGWSGHMDFLQHGKFIDLLYSLEDVHESRVDQNIFVKGARWAQVTESDFKKRVAKFRTRPEIPKEWAKDLSEKLKTMYSFSAISSMYDVAFKDVL